MKTKRRKSKQRANSKERPTRQITELADRGGVQPLLQKYFRSLLKQITCLSHAVSSHRGAVRDRHGRGAGCGGRGMSKDERRCARTAKSCGADAPTLASNWRKRFRR